MSINVTYGGESVPGYNELLDRYPLNQFNSPRRSTVPLFAYWKKPERALDFLWHLDLQPPEKLTLAFEYEVPVQMGKGFPSCTDLMILGEQWVVAVEAKYMEPEYETVRQWLRKVHSENRRSVLLGWLSLINQTTGSHLTYSDVLDISYQSIHRAASACYPRSGEPGIARFMVYQLFTDADLSVVKIVRDLAALEKMIPPGTLQFACLQIEVEKKACFRALEDRWIKEKERLLRDEVREGLREDRLFEFSRPVICSVMAE